MEITKIKTYVGFAKKSREIVLGTTEIIKHKSCHIIFYSSNLSPASEKKLKNFAKNNNLIITALDDNIFRDIINSDAIKSIGITNKNLANAIVPLLENSEIGGHFEQSTK